MAPNPPTSGDTAPAPSTSSSLTKRPAPGSLMPPPPAPKRIKRPAIVLDEDTYTTAISHIIRRDFFPGLAETDAQREYLNAVESGNKKWIREAGKTLVDVMTPGPGARKRGAAATAFKVPGGAGVGRGAETPSVWGGDTPVSVAGTERGGDAEGREGEGEGEGVVKPDLSLSLSAFQAKYTSEDQESFSRILDRQNAARFAKTAWLRDGNKMASKQRIAQQKVIEARKTSSSTPTSTSAIHAGASTELAVIPRPSQNLDDRPTHVEFKKEKHQPLNTLMFAPDSIEDWAPTRAQAAENASLAAPKAVVHANTRLPAPPSTDPEVPARPSSPTMSAVRDAISGRPRLSQSEIGGSVIGTGAETPRVNGYAFVDAVGPEQYEDKDDEAPTDLLERLGAKTTGPNPFSINESQRREKLHLKMVDRIAEKRVERKDSTALASSGRSLGIFNGKDTPRFLTAPTPGGRAGATPGGMTPGRKNIGNLTPAAQRLFANVNAKGGVGGGGFGGERGRGKGREWTPTPRVRRKA